METTRRRDFLRAVGAGVAVAAVSGGGDIGVAATGGVPKPGRAAAALARKLPRWRGFNLREKISSKSISRVGAKPLPGNLPFREQDFEWIAELGFNFVRLPMDYHCWSGGDGPRRLNEKALREIDQAVEWGRQYRIHVCLNMHHAPGYRVGWAIDPCLWTDEKPLELFCFYWSMFAKRYRGVPSSRLSFNLVNEPGRIKPGVYVTAEMCDKVYRRAIDAIRREDADRLIIVDGLLWAQKPLPGLADIQVAQSTHWYQPRELTHYKAPWLKKADWPKPAWPMKRKGRLLDRRWLRAAHVKPWKALEAKGVGVHVGEWGVLDTVPHDIALRWTRDCLELWKEAGWGWALWNFRGENGFGFLDTHRADVKYEDFHGRRLDRKMLELARET